jgi:hypothetical protein
VKDTRSFVVVGRRPGDSVNNRPEEILSLNESVLGGYYSLSDAVRKIPRKGSGRKVSIGSVERWARKGIRGVRLKTIKAGGMRCTSDEWLLEFFESIARSERRHEPQLKDRAVSQHTGRREAVESRLAEIGI